MSYLTGDTNQITLFYESGTWASTSGAAVWPGQVLSNTIDEDMGVIQNRYAGTASRNVGQFVDGPQNFVGALSFRPQNWRLFKFALGSCVDGGSPTPFLHTYTETNNGVNVVDVAGQSLPSFGLEDAQVTVTGSNFVRTVRGCFVDSMIIRASEGEPVTVDVNYVGKTNTFSSGAKSTVTADTQRPYMWSDVRVHIPSGTTYDQVKDFSFELNNNLAVPHYLDTTRTIGLPIPQNRDYTVSLTLNSTDANTKTLYDQYLVGGSTFNMLLGVIAIAGSREAIITCSGCKMLDMGAPSTNEGVQEQTLTIMPQSVSVLETNELQYFNAGSVAGF